MATQTIGIDWAKGKDHSAVVYSCSACNHVVCLQSYDDYDYGLPVNLYKRCPHCKAEFYKHQIIEE